MLFRKKEFASPVSGNLLSIENVPDQAFAQKMLGDGFAISPIDGRVYAPANGTILVAFPTKHAIGMKLEDMSEILIHVGIDTVELNGKGFKSYVKEGQAVKKGDLLLEADIGYLVENGKSPITMIVFTNGNRIKLKKKEKVTALEGVGMVING